MSDNNIEKTYSPEAFESRWYKEWEESGAFKTSSDSNKNPYVIMMPPPNVTGVLHMGHALQDSIQDTLIRYKRMKQFEALWQPGTDHAGIATQNVVEKELAKQGISRHDLGRDAFVDKVWEWKHEHGNIISRQKRKLGDSADWSKERFTLDEGLSRAVRECFVTLYEKGLIYRGHRIVNWCPRCKTAISDEEVEHREKAGNLWHIKYPAADGSGYVVVATTRPETMLGDTAVAIHPEDERYQHLKGKTLILPLTDRAIPIVLDEYVNKDFGTGCVKVTPAHDPNDFEIGQRHNLEQIVVIDESGKMNENAPEKYQGMDRYVCRKKVIEDLKEAGLLEKIDDHGHNVGECSRCTTVIEPYLSNQWFVKMKPLAEPAIEAVRNGSLKIYPKRWEKVYFDWLENIRDWCISRQLWWGHRIPVFYCADCDNIMVLREDTDSCQKCGSKNVSQDEDVLDTWFSSWLWPFSTLGWPEPGDNFKYFYPTDVLVSSYDIIFFWIARMVMAGLEFTGTLPFKHIYLTGMVKDKLGRKMSKSLGNGINPLDMIAQYGADAVRFSLVYLCTEGQDVNLDPTRFEMGRNFANKLWNAFRFCNGYLDGKQYESPDFSKLQRQEDRWIITKLNQLVNSVEEYWAEYRMSAGLHEIYQFLWRDFCDWYIEMVKSRFQGDDEQDKHIARQVLYEVFTRSVKILHPVMPFITEEIWSFLKPGSSFLMHEKYPEFKESEQDDKACRFIEKLQEVVSQIRNLRSQLNIAPGARIAVIGNLEESFMNLFEYKSDICNLARLKSFEPGKKPEKGGVVSSVCSCGELYIMLEGVDLEKEKDRLRKEIEKLQKTLSAKNNKLQNPKFMEKAKAEVIEATRKEAQELEDMCRKLEEQIADFSA